MTLAEALALIRGESATAPSPPLGTRTGDPTQDVIRAPGPQDTGFAPPGRSAYGGLGTIMNLIGGLAPVQPGSAAHRLSSAMLGTPAPEPEREAVGFMPGLPSQPKVGQPKVGPPSPGAPRFRVEANFEGQWVPEALGFESRADAQRYIKNSRFWDGFSRRSVKEGP